jgi:hypothetical protein
MFPNLCSLLDDLKIFRVIKSAKDCKLLQSDIDSVQKRCIENYLKINIAKTNIIYFIRKTKSIHFNYFLDDLLIIRTNCVNNLWVVLVTKLYFHHHVDNLHFQATEIFMNIFSSSDSLNILYVTLIFSKLVYASLIWSNLTVPDSNKLEKIQRKFTNLCYNRFIEPKSFCNNESMLNYWHFKTLYLRLQTIDFYFSLTFSRTKLVVALLRILLVSVHPVSKLEIFRLWRP